MTIIGSIAKFFIEVCGASTCLLIVFPLGSSNWKKVAFVIDTSSATMVRDETLEFLCIKTQLSSPIA